jgi:hypothetical protein
MGTVRVFKGKGDGGDLPMPEVLRAVGPRGELLYCEGCIVGIACSQLLMDHFW